VRRTRGCLFELSSRCVLSFLFLATTRLVCVFVCPFHTYSHSTIAMLQLCQDFHLMPGELSRPDFIGLFKQANQGWVAVCFVWRLPQP